MKREAADATSVVSDASLPASSSSEQLAAALPASWEVFAAECGVASDDMPALAELNLTMHSLHRRRTVDVFETGRCMVAVAVIVPEDKFHAWNKRVYGYSRTHATNFMNVHVRLCHLRHRFEAVEASSTALVTLATQNEAKVEEVLAAMEKGNKLTIAGIKAMLKDPNEAPAPIVPLTEIGGPAGITAMSRQMVKTSFADLVGRISSIVSAIEAAMGSGTMPKRVTKSKLGPQVEPLARRARRELEHLILPLVPTNDIQPWHMAPMRLDPKSGWGFVITLLNELGDMSRWPSGPVLLAWLRGTVVPTLLWTTGSPKGKLPKVEARLMPTRTEARVESVDESEVVETVEPAKAVAIVVKATEGTDAAAEADDAMAGDTTDEAVAPIALQPTANQKLTESAATKAPRTMVRPDFLMKTAQAGSSASPTPKL
ncbi:hypothetical protein NGM99_18310 [Mesorhizobium sp. RP14(2022)]|uniref:Uncharacterized protein n=1 Tax=Mesorhizobium liriopis TaxID=2953882 RepID=A0ABT1CB99_9HYPH|nr:hypothetical protein [Mesorhizobium liriopis]MCO6051743.1 hypothetical protein [Mesorhizobium liriopis]